MIQNSLALVPAVLIVVAAALFWAGLGSSDWLEYQFPLTVAGVSVSASLTVAPLKYCVAASASYLGSEKICDTSATCDYVNGLISCTPSQVALGFDILGGACASIAFFTLLGAALRPGLAYLKFKSAWSLCAIACVCGVISFASWTKYYNSINSYTSLVGLSPSYGPGWKLVIAASVLSLIAGIISYFLGKRMLDQSLLARAGLPFNNPNTVANPMVQASNGAFDAGLSQSQQPYPGYPAQAYGQQPQYPQQSQFPPQPYPAQGQTPYPPYPPQSGFPPQPYPPQSQYPPQQYPQAYPPQQTSQQSDYPPQAFAPPQPHAAYPQYADSQSHSIQHVSVPDPQGDSEA